MSPVRLSCTHRSGGEPRVGIPVVSLGVAIGTGEAWGSTGFSVPFGSASVTALGVVKWVPMSRLARTHL